MRWKNIKNLPGHQFRRVCGIKPSTFLKLAELLKPKWNLRRKSGGPKPKLSMENQILLTLSYWRNYGTFLKIGTEFQVSESTAFNICRWIEDNLKTEKVLHLPGKKELLIGKEKHAVVIFDVTECPIERPKRNKKGRRKNRQKQYYSGKKKKHTIKQQIVVSKTGKIIATSQANGKTHDFKIFKNSKNRIHTDTKMQGDSAYQGVHRMHANSEIPKKSQKKIH